MLSFTAIRKNAQEFHERPGTSCEGMELSMLVMELCDAAEHAERQSKSKIAEAQSAADDAASKASRAARR